MLYFWWVDLEIYIQNNIWNFEDSVLLSPAILSIFEIFLIDHFLQGYEAFPSLLCPTHILFKSFLNYLSNAKVYST